MTVDYNDGKIHGWNGGFRPVHPKSLVEAWCDEGAISEKPASEISWYHQVMLEVGGSAHIDSPYNVIAFRVTKVHREPMATPKKTIWVNEYSEDNRGVAYFSEEEAKENFKYCTRIAVKYQEVVKND